MTQEQPARLEIATIQPIPPDQRHGTAADLFTVWFGSNLMLLTIVTGGLAVTVFGLSFWWAVIGLAVGNMTGAVFMALHAAQGPTLGVPQMIQTRGQFGSLGSLLVVGIVLIMYVGFLASNLVLGGQALASLVPGASDVPGIALVGVLSRRCGDLRLRPDPCLRPLDELRLRRRAHRHGGLDHRSARSAAGFSTAQLLQRRRLHGHRDPRQRCGRSRMRRTSPITPATCRRPRAPGRRFGRAIGDAPWAHSCPWCWVPWSASARRRAIWWRVSPDSPRASHPLVLIVFSVGVAAANAMNLYCGALSALTFGQTVVPRWSPGPRARTFMALLLFGLSLLGAVLGKAAFLVNYEHFILFLLYVLVPWTAINLVDYYLLRHGIYDVASFFRQDGGIYGRVNVAAVTCYGLGIVVQLPFIDSALYTGAAARAMGGVDLSWIVGLAVTSPAYYWLASRSPARAPLPARDAG